MVPRGTTACWNGLQSWKLGPAEKLNLCVKRPGQVWNFTEGTSSKWVNGNHLIYLVKVHLTGAMFTVVKKENLTAFLSWRVCCTVNAALHPAGCKMLVFKGLKIGMLLKSQRLLLSVIAAWSTHPPSRFCHLYSHWVAVPLKSMGLLLELGPIPHTERWQNLALSWVVVHSIFVKLSLGSCTKFMHLPILWDFSSKQTFKQYCLKFIPRSLLLLSPT